MDEGRAVNRRSGAWWVGLLPSLLLAACGPDLVVPETPLPLAWQARVGPVINRPAASDGLIFVVDEGGRLIALDRESGKRRWMADLARSSSNEGPVAADGGRVVAAARGEPGKVVAFEARSGAQRWEVPFGPSLHAGHPVAAGGVVYFAAADPESGTVDLHAADAATGGALWACPIGSSIAAAPIVGAGLVYVGGYQLEGPAGTTRRVLAIDTATGRVRWVYPSDLDLSGQFALDRERLYLGADGGVVIARDAATGAASWTARVGGRLSNSPEVGGGLVYVGTRDGAMTALRAEDGTERWKLEVGSPVLTQVAVAGGRIFFGSSDGILHAVDAATGAEEWAVRSPRREPIGVQPYVPAMATTPVVAGDLLLYFNGNALNALELG